MIDSNNMGALAWLRKQLDEDGNDLVAEMASATSPTLMAAEVDALTGTGWGEQSPDRVNPQRIPAPTVRHPGGHDRPRHLEAAPAQLLPGLAVGPRWLAEKALVSVVAECYVRGVSTRRIDGLVKTLGTSRCRSRRGHAWPPSSTRSWPSSPTSPSNPNSDALRWAGESPAQVAGHLT